MSWSFLLFFCALVFTISLGVSFYLIKFAKENNILDQPGERSSHDVPTPRGGGVAIALAIIVCILWVLFKGAGEWASWAWLGVSTSLVALVAIVDDVKGLSAITRGALYLLFSCMFVWFNENTPALFLLELISIVISVFALAWMTNLYNFMDGADGIAAIQAVIVALPTGSIFLVTNHQDMALLCFAVVASALGFLVWNWAPAKIFMGDAGSCTLGFFIGCLMYLSYVNELLSIHVWLILMSIFIIDSSLTLMRRMFLGEKWYVAHRCHAYQRYLQMGNSHRKLAVNFILLGVMLIWPLAYLAYKYPQKELTILMIVYALFSYLWYFIQNSYSKLSSNGQSTT